MIRSCGVLRGISRSLLSLSSSVSVQRFQRASLSTFKYEEATDEEFERLRNKVEDEILHHRKPGRGLLRSFMSMILRRKKLKQGIQLLELMKAEKIQPHGEIIRMMITLLAHFDEREAALRMYNSYLRSGGMPSVQIFEAVAKLYQATGDIFGIEQITAHMKQFNIHPNYKIAQYFIDTCGLGGAPRKAEMIFHSIMTGSRKKLDPPLSIFHSMLRVYLRTDEHAKFSTLYDHLYLYNLQPDQTCDRLLMLSHAKQKKFAKAREVFRQIQQNNPAVKPSVVESMLAIYAMERQPEAATAFFKRIPGLIEDGKASVKMFNLLLRVYDRSAYMTRLWLAYRSMRERFQIEPDAETFAILTNAFARRGEFERAYGISEHALKKGVELDADTVCFQLVTAAKKRDYQWTKIFLQQLKKRLVRPTVQVRAAFAYAKTLNGEGHQALKEAEKLEPNREVLKGILAAASLVGSASVMEAAFEALLKQFPHGPDRSTVKILANGYRMLGDFQMLSKVVQQAERDGLGLDNELYSMRLHANCELDLMDEVAKDLELIRDQQIDGEAYQALGKLNLRTTRKTTFESKYSANFFQMTIRAGQRVDSGLGKKWITPLEPMPKSEGKVYSQRTLDALFNTKRSAPTAVRMFQDDTESAIRALTLFTFKSSQEAIQEDTLKAADDSRQLLSNDGSEQNDLRVLIDSTS